MPPKKSKKLEAQRNETPEAEMADTPPNLVPAQEKPKKNGGRPKKVAAEAAAEAGGAAAAPAPVAMLPEAVVAEDAALALAGAGPLGPPEDLDAPEEKQSAIRFCPVCRYYLYLQVTPRGAGEDGSEQNTSLVRLCRNCGFKEEDTKGGLVMEMMIKERSSEGYKVLLNEFTRRDPRLPHIRGSIKCPDPACDSNQGRTPSDIIYIKHDPVNLLYLYICDVCGHTWRSRR